jgi:hypothetical protein
MSFPVPPPALPTFGTHIDSCGGFRNDYGHSTGYSVNSCGSIQNSYGQGTGYSVDSYGTICAAHV